MTVQNVRQLITVSEVAQLLAVDVWTVRRYARTGIIPAYKVGRGYRFDPDTVRAWLESRQVHPAAPAADVLPLPVQPAERSNKVRAVK